MDRSHEERAAKTAQRALRMLDQEQVYNHLYVLGANHAHNRYEAEDRMRSLWGLLYDIAEVDYQDTPKRDRLLHLRDLAQRYLREPYLHSLWVRNLLIEKMFTVTYADPRSDYRISDKAFWTILIGAAALSWI